MIRATVGVWVNYATTAAFQIVFALRYGSGTEASVFVIVFGVAIAVGGVIAVSVQSVIVPRLPEVEGESSGASCLRRGCTQCGSDGVGWPK